MKISFYFKIVLLVGALVGVFYVIGALRSGAVESKMSDPTNALSLLVGAEARPLNWCPAETREVKIYSDEGAVVRTLTTLSDISSVCEVLIGTFSSEGIDESSYRKLLSAHNTRGEEKILEQIPGKPIYRSLGLPFNSIMLEKNITRRAAP